MKSISILLASFSIILCLVLIYFLSIPEFAAHFKVFGTKRYILISILAAYAIFRTYRAYKSYQINKSDDL